MGDVFLNWKKERSFAHSSLYHSFFYEDYRSFSHSNLYGLSFMKIISGSKGKGEYLGVCVCVCVYLELAFGN